MTKTELIAAIAKRVNMTKSDTENVLEAFLDTIAYALRDGEEVRLVGFGIFSPRKRLATTARNPKTREEVVVPESIVPVFKAGKTLREIVDPKKSDKQSAA